MARPRTSDDERRSECFAIRLTPAERIALLDEAERLSISPTSLARQRLIRGRVVVQQHRRLDPRQAFELGRIGVNLNQIARALNSDQRLNPAVVQSAIAELKELIATLLRPEPEIPISGNCQSAESTPPESPDPSPTRPSRPGRRSPNNPNPEAPGGS